MKDGGVARMEAGADGKELYNQYEMDKVNALLFFKQKTAYEMESRDWSSDVCSSD
eukprot:COSAG05_NODE_23613_length_257_cov_0.430380_1_plen_54_part_01